MAGDRYIVITVAYDRHFCYGQSLAWVAPELSDAGLRVIADQSEGSTPTRTWAGMVDGPTFRRFAGAWCLAADVNDRRSGSGVPDGRASTLTYTLDGMNWEIDGVSPIVYVTLHVTPVTKVRQSHNRGRLHVPAR